MTAATLMKPQEILGVWNYFMDSTDFLDNFFYLSN